MSTLPPPPPLGGGGRTGFDSDRPTALRTATIVLAGTVAGVDLIAALAGRDVYAHLSDYASPGATPDAAYIASQGLGNLSGLLTLATFITLALWMTRVHKRLTDAGERMPLASGWAWGAWFIPVAQLVLPYIYLRGLNRRARSWALTPWWIAWVATIVPGFWAIARIISLSDLSLFGTDPNDPFLGLDLSPLGPALVAVALIRVVAWAFMAVTLVDITARDTQEPASASSAPGLTER